MLAIVVDKQQISSMTPSYENIYQTNQPWALTSIIQVGRFRILKTIRMAFPVEDKTARNFQMSVNLSMKMRWNGVEAGEQQQNGVYLVYISDQDMPSDQPVLDCQARLTYTDN